MWKKFLNLPLIRGKNQELFYPSDIISKVLIAKREKHAFNLSVVVGDIYNNLDGLDNVLGTAFKRIYRF